MSAPGTLAVVTCASLAMLATGCGFTELHEVILRRPGPRSSSVEIYLGDRLPARPFYEIALLQAVGHGTDASLEDTTHAIEQRAITLGCDAVVKLRFDQGYSMANAVGVCVRWSVPVPVPVPAPAPAPEPAPPPPEQPVPQPEPAPSAPQGI